MRVDNRSTVTTQDKTFPIENLISGAEISRELRTRKSDFNEKTVPDSDERAHLEAGWEVVRHNKKTVRVRRLKPVGLRLEDELWTLFARLGFEQLNHGHNFKIPIGSPESGVPPKQIDVFAMDSETTFVIECKASESRTTKSLSKDLNETRGLQNSIRSAIRETFPSRLRVCFVYASRNIRWSRQDLARARDNQISILRDKQIDYYRKLVDIIGPAARHQLQADLLAGSSVSGLNATVPALRGTFGGQHFYQFVIEPDHLLKLAYVSHRTKIDANALGTYQRILRKSRLKNIANHINDTGGVFPTNIVVNFRGQRRLKFDASGPIENNPTVLGTLHLPNTYKSAYVIDGQHRLYGFALSERPERGRIPVLAFENLQPEEEVKMFVDINSKQVKVPRSLLVELEPEIIQQDATPTELLRRTHSKLAVDLSESDESPLWDRVASEWETSNATRPITLPQLAQAIAGSQLIGSVRNGMLYPGPLFRTDWPITEKRAIESIEKFLSLFAEEASEQWDKERSEGGFLCTNLGIASLLRLFNAILEHKQSTNPNLELHRLTPDAIVGTASDLILPLLEWFNSAVESDMAVFRGHYGSGAPIAYGYSLMQIVNETYSEFSPAGLTEHIQAYSSENVNAAQTSVSYIEDTIRKTTIGVLESIYGRDWWTEGVPSSIRVKAAGKNETNSEGGEPHEFLELLDYKKIAEQSRLWRNFDSLWTVDRSHRSKEEKLSWMNRLNTIRNRVSHSGRRSITNEEIEFLNDIENHIRMLTSV